MASVKNPIYSIEAHGRLAGNLSFRTHAKKSTVQYFIKKRQGWRATQIIAAAAQSFTSVFFRQTPIATQVTFRQNAKRNKMAINNYILKLAYAALPKFPDGDPSLAFLAHFRPLPFWLVYNDQPTDLTITVSNVPTSTDPLYIYDPTQVFAASPLDPLAFLGFMSDLPNQITPTLTITPTTTNPPTFTVAKPLPFPNIFIVYLDQSFTQPALQAWQTYPNYKLPLTL